jgi:hypothetical protein
MALTFYCGGWLNIALHKLDSSQVERKILRQAEVQMDKSSFVMTNGPAAVLGDRKRRTPKTMICCFRRVGNAASNLGRQYAGSGLHSSGGHRGRGAGDAAGRGVL